MRLGVWFLLVVTLGACTRNNPAFGDGEGDDGSEPDSTTSGGLTDGRDDSSSSTRGTSEGDGTGTSGGVGVDETSGSVSESSDEGNGCEPTSWQLEPSADTFIVRSEAAICGGSPCGTVNFGAAADGLIEDVGPAYQSYLLMEFDLSELAEARMVTNAALSLTVRTSGPAVLEVLQLPPVTWEEGGGNGTQPASPAESTWLWSAQPEPWMTAMGTGPFDHVLENTPPSVTTYNAPLLDPPQAIAIPIPNATLQGWLAGPPIIHLAITVSKGAEARTFSRESNTAPLLHIEGC